MEEQPLPQGKIKDWLLGCGHSHWRFHSSEESKAGNCRREVYYFFPDLYIFSDIFKVRKSFVQSKIFLSSPFQPFRAEVENQSIQRFGDSVKLLSRLYGHFWAWDPCGIGGSIPVPCKSSTPSFYPKQAADQQELVTGTCWDLENIVAKTTMDWGPNTAVWWSASILEDLICGRPSREKFFTF